MRDFARLLQAEAVDASLADDLRRAYDAALFSFKSGEQLAHDPFLISQLVRIACAGVSAETLAEVLGHGPLRRTRSSRPSTGKWPA